MQSLAEFFLNQGTNSEKQVVEASAFSLTKVLGAGAVIITPLATLLVEQLKKHDNFKAGHYVALALGVLGFLAITAAADVLSRGFVTAAEKEAKAAKAGGVQAAANMARLVPFETPITGLRALSGPDETVKVLAAASGDHPYLLVQGKDDKITWVRAKDVKVGTEA
jgi:hypothetical protein